MGFNGSTATATVTETESSDGLGGSEGNDLLLPSSSSSDPYDCSDFDSRDQVQQVLENTAGRDHLANRVDALTVDQCV
jgi:hypothetical protein